MVVRRLIAVASLAVGHRLQGTGSVVVVNKLSCPMECGVVVPRPGIAPVSPALAGEFLTTGPPEKFLSGNLDGSLTRDSEPQDPAEKCLDS